MAELQSRRYNQFGQGLMTRPTFEQSSVNGQAGRLWASRSGPIDFTKMALLAGNAAAILSVLKSRSASIVIELWLIAKQLTGDQQMKVGVDGSMAWAQLSPVILNIAWGAFDGSHFSPSRLWV